MLSFANNDGQRCINKFLVAVSRLLFDRDGSDGCPAFCVSVEGHDL
jgi:hypothetical protein